MSSQESRQRFSQTCAFLPGSCLPADDGGNLGSLCLQLRSLSIVAGSQTSSPWRRMSQGQNFCTPVPEKRHLRTHAVYTVSSMHQRLRIACVACGKCSVFIFGYFHLTPANIWWLTFLNKWFGG